MHLLRHVFALGAVAATPTLIGGCTHGADPPTQTLLVSFTLSLTQPALSIAQGASTPTTTVNIARTNFTTDVTLTVLNRPAGVTASFAPANPISGNSSVLTLTVPLATPVGVYNTLAVQGVVQGVGTVTTPLTLTVTAAPAPPEFTLAIAAGDNQTATLNTTVGTAPAVRITDKQGAGVAGIALTWLVQQGNGLFPTPSPVTDADGYARLQYFVPTTDGPIVLQVRSNDARVGPPFVNFGFTGTGPLSPPQVTRNPLGFPEPQNGVAGLPVGMPPSVKVAFATGQPSVGVLVRFSVTSGGGTLGLVGTPTSYQAPTDVAGVVTVPVWVPGPGTNVVEASVGQPGDNVVGSPVKFTANIPVNAGLKLAIAAGDNQSAEVNTAVVVPPAIRVTDLQGAGVANIAITWTILSGAGLFTTETTPSVTDANGFARLRNFVPTQIGPIRLQASTSAGTTPQSVVFNLAGTPRP